MIKKLVLFALAVGILMTSVFFLQEWFISFRGKTLSYSLLSIYYFHFVAFVIIVGSVGLLSNIVPNQVGFVFLAGIFVKIGFFVMIFNDTVFGDIPLEMHERIAIIIPFFMFLVAEALYSGMIMNEK